MTDSTSISHEIRPAMATFRRSDAKYIPVPSEGGIVSGILKDRKVPDVSAAEEGYSLAGILKEAASCGYTHLLTAEEGDLPRWEKLLASIVRTPEKIVIFSSAAAATAETQTKNGKLPEASAPGTESKKRKRYNRLFYIETGYRISDPDSPIRIYPLEKIAGTPLKRLSSSASEPLPERRILFEAARKEIAVAELPLSALSGLQEQDDRTETEIRSGKKRSGKDRHTARFLSHFLMCSYALAVLHPVRFFQRNLLHIQESDSRISAAVALGIFSAIIPIWGYQLLFALTMAHILKLNKVIAALASNISLPPIMPFILYGSLKLGEQFIKTDEKLSLSNLTMESVGNSLLQYVVGSLLLAALCAVLSFFLTWGILTAVHVAGRLRNSGKTTHTDR